MQQGFLEGFEGGEFAPKILSQKLFLGTKPSQLRKNTALLFQLRKRSHFEVTNILDVDVLHGRSTRVRQKPLLTVLLQQ